jgi:predicted phage baseplate assembly protein
VVIDKDNVVSVVFGDGISGAIPTLQAVIRAKYIVGGGTIGNIATSLIDSISYIPGLTSNQTAALSGNVSVTNTVTGVGGQDPESSSSIRLNAPLFLRAQNRAVTLEDFENLALSVDNCGKAKAVSTGYTSVTVYLAPRRDSGDADATPGLETTSPYGPTIEWTALRDTVKAYLADKVLAGTSVTYTIPTYVPVTLNIQYKLDPAYTTAEAESNIKTSIINNFSYFYQDFGSVITAQDIEFVLQTVPGITKGKVQFLYKTGGTPSIVEITAANNEILSFAEGSLILEAL